MLFLTSMIKTIERLVAAAKNLAVAIACTSLSTCAVTYARRDYGQYPAHRRDIAVFNMRAMAGDFCSSRPFRRYPTCDNMVIGDVDLSFTTTNCDQVSYVSNGNSRHMSCDHETHSPRTIYWTSIRKVIPIGESVRVCDQSADCKTIYGFRNARQAADFAEAMSMYLR